MTKLPELSPREREVFSLIAQGRTDYAIGRELKISEHTVDQHVRHVFAKLRLAGVSVSNRTDIAVRYALQKPDKRQLSFSI
jgi:DNA-binding CsgD family transcriptional regulator